MLYHDYSQAFTIRLNVTSNRFVSSPSISRDSIHVVQSR